MLLAIVGAPVVPLALRYVGPGALGERESLYLSLNDRLLVSSAPQFCERIGVTADDEVNGVSATLILTNHLSRDYGEPDLASQDDVMETFVKECVVLVNGETSCALVIPIVPGYFVFLQTNSSDGMAHNSNHTLAFSLSCEPRTWLYVAIAVSTTALVLLFGCGCLCCCACLCKAKKQKEDHNLFIYTPLLDHSSQEGESDSREHSLIVGSINSPSSVKKQDTRTLQIEASSSYRYSTFKPGTKAGGSMSPFAQHEAKSSTIPNKANTKDTKPRTISSTSYTFNTFKPNN